MFCRLFRNEWILLTGRSVHRCGWVVVLLCLGSSLAGAQAPLFQRLSPEQTHVGFSNEINENESLNVLSYEYLYNGGGVAVGDLNGDGLLDIFFTANQKPNKLYLNQGGLTFKDVTAEAAPELGGREGGWKTGVSFADVNGDGRLDIYVCYSGKVDEAKRRNQLFINQSNGPLVRFVEQANEYGLDDPGYSTQAAFFDYDRDGDLDLFLLNHNVKKYDNMELARLHGETDQLAGNKLFENRKGKFTDVTQKASIHQYPLTFGLGVAVADINQDGWPDLYVTNDYNEPDYLYVNQKNGSFSDQTGACFRHLPQFSMGVDIADFNNDGLPDVMSLDMLPEDNRRQKLLQLQENYESFELMVRQGLQKQYMRNMLQLNNGDGRDGVPTFSEIAQTAGVSNTDWSWSPLLADFDNDGYKDLFITNGYLRDYTNKDFLKYWGDYKVKKAINRESVQLMDLVRAMPSTKVPNYIFRNNHDLTFANKQREWGLDIPSISSGAAVADLDGDGDLELIVNNINEPASIYQNLSREQAKNAYLQLKLVARKSNPTAVGATVTVWANGTMQYQEVNSVRGYLSSQPLTLHFGLGTATVADSILIIWPDGSRQPLTRVPVNQQLVVQQNATSAARPVATPKLPPALFTKAEPMLAHTHEGYTENDFKRQPLMLWMSSHTGPVLTKGDVNKDGLDDLFISGDQKKPGSVWVQQKGSRSNGAAFKKIETLAIGNEETSAVAAACFFDANGDGYDDLYVAKGGYSLFEPNTPSLQDELYVNDGHGNLSLSGQSLPNVNASSKACVRPADYDNDGDLDLFVGGRIVPGRYPEAPVSYLLQNDGKSQFTIVETPFSTVGMVTDAQWTDVDGDNRTDLIIVGEFMPVKVYQNTKSGFIDQTAQYFRDDERGFWQSLTVADVNGDGRQDLIVGNLGTNSQIKFSQREPAELYYADFDNNGSIDPFFTCYVQGTAYPFVSRDELNDQMYAMRKRFGFYKDYADATMQTIFPAEALAGAKKLTATECHSVCFLNQGGRFEKHVLPIQAQFAPVTHIRAGDFDHDGRVDLLLFGNKSDNRLKLGSMDANYGCLLTGDGKGDFQYVSQPTSGLSVVGDVKSVVELGVGGQNQWVIGAFGQPLQVYQLAQPNRTGGDAAIRPAARPKP